MVSLDFALSVLVEMEKSGIAFLISEVLMASCAALFLGAKHRSFNALIKGLCNDGNLEKSEFNLALKLCKLLMLSRCGAVANCSGLVSQGPKVRWSEEACGAWEGKKLQ
ncbi:hypothetical protein NE237_033223 [Protea cynaroides]|uniref:Pentatricopeptide repeat-containing protein n=1 Tax=Protea cynaroides TaxID=273540 RepID=A0A9Q0L6N1_9MAGN|nr:hypothetical protein NE237_033223 [Protea cynaroides]